MGGCDGRRGHQTARDVLRQREILETAVITLDTPELKPFHAARTSIVVPVTQDGRLVEEQGGGGDDSRGAETV